VIRHMFFGKVKEGVSEAEVDRLVTAWNAMDRRSRTLRSITAGRNPARPTSATPFALVADFDDWAGYKVYGRSSRAHAIQARHLQQDHRSRQQEHDPARIVSRARKKLSAALSSSALPLKCIEMSPELRRGANDRESTHA